MNMHLVGLAIELRACHCSHSSGGSFGNYLIFSWLWREIGWWSLLVYTAFVVLCGAIRAALGGDDDC